jgi:Holliday junction resolvase RusA-like endonuclease
MRRVLASLSECCRGPSRLDHPRHRGAPLTGPLAVTIDLYWPDRRKHDADNIKVLLDALTGIVWEDDGQISDLHIVKWFDKAEPRVKMKVLKLCVNFYRSVR